ncbi:hypothetical protein NIES4072_44810 [Nostoc commune NIES-4072]|uniref:Uncharacterized protein n=1 Tax=Nostoc commune NIES-4072 TaxID=2005467 RepID=A0A2R5FRY9_NOSCO|nr:hypothetical protein NIES4070_46020 [Nostoc commune HK-02]GBG20799.1 hypothetical protein NIES4072_44810 [Nostoc commune NIES-4072]
MIRFEDQLFIQSVDFSCAAKLSSLLGGFTVTLITLKIDIVVKPLANEN